MDQGLQQLHQFAVDTFHASFAATRELGHPGPCRLPARRIDPVRLKRLLVSRHGGRAPMVEVDDRSRSAVPECIVTGRPPAPTLCWPAGPSLCTLVHCPGVVLRVRTSCALIGTCSCRCDNCDLVAIVALLPLLQPCSRPSAGRKTRPRVANRGQPDSGPAAAALQQQAQRPRQTAYRAKHIPFQQTFFRTFFDLFGPLSTFFDLSTVSFISTDPFFCGAAFWSHFHPNSPRERVKVW